MGDSPGALVCYAILSYKLLLMKNWVYMQNFALLLVFYWILPNKLVSPVYKLNFFHIYSFDLILFQRSNSICFQNVNFSCERITKTTCPFRVLEFYDKLGVKYISKSIM